MKEQIFHRLYDQYHQDVFGFLMYLIKDRQIVEDLTQDVYIRAIKSYESFQQQSTEKTWLFAIAKNVAIDYFRKQSVRAKHAFDFFDWENEQLVTADKSPEQLALLSEDKQVLLDALEKCSGDQKMVVILRYIQQLSIAETAQILNWTEAKVKTTQHRAIQKLKEMVVNTREEEKLYE